MLYRKLNNPLVLASVIFFAVPTVLLSPSVIAQRNNIRTQRVQFKPGANSANIQGRIRGYETVDYVLNARKGQYMNVSMATNNGANYFNILAPGENEVAMFNGSTRGNQYEGTLPQSGDYKIRVYMMRSAARQNQVANYRLEMIISGSSNANSEDDALVEGTNYHATGNISCTMGNGQPSTSCFFGVTRQGNGSGTVTVKKPNGSTRTFSFKNGNATGYDSSQADKGRFRAEKEGDLNIIRIGSERYEIPDAVIFGG